MADVEYRSLDVLDAYIYNFGSVAAMLTYF